MTEKTSFLIKEEEWEQKENDPCFDPLDTTVSCKTEEDVKPELRSLFETEDDVQFDEFHLKTEEVDVSDMEFPTETDSETENEPPPTKQIAEDLISVDKSLGRAAQLSTSSEILCRPCFVLLEQIDLNAKANPAVFFACSLCKFGFTSKVRLDRHQRLSCRLRIFDDPLKTALDYMKPLPKNIPTTLELNAKFNKPESTPKKRYKCKKCSYSTDVGSHFKRHVVTHTGARNFACTQCEYKATQKGDLAKHLLTHDGVKPYACTVCNYRAVQKGSMTRHMRLHTGEKPFKCNQCDYACNESSHLASHVRSKHTKDRPYACTQCKYTCVRSSHLASHMSRHTREKNVTCTQCSYKCKHPRDLKCHTKTKHKG